MHEDIELTGIITDDDQAVWQAMGEYSAEQGTFSGNQDVSVSRDAQVV